jgi:hypothetical protein
LSTSTALVITALSNAMNEDGNDEVFAVRVTVYVSSGRFEKEARRFELGPTITSPEPLPPFLRSKLTSNAARVAFP